MLTFTGCNDKDQISSEEVKDYPVKVGSVTISEMPHKIISLSPSITEIIFALGAQTKLYGVSDYCDYPQRATEMPRFGTPSLPDIEGIIQLSPDVILTSSPLPDEDASALAMQKIPVFVFSAAQSYQELETLYRHIASIVSGNKTGPVNSAATYQRIRGKIDAITAEQGEPAAKSVYISALSPDGKSAYVASGAVFAGILVEAAGADNIARDVTDYSMTFEEIAAAAPDFIFCAAELEETVKGNAVLSALPGVKITPMAPVLMERQGERVVDAVRLMADIILPKPPASSGDASSGGEASSAGAASVS